MPGSRRVKHRQSRHTRKNRQAGGGKLSVLPINGLSADQLNIVNEATFEDDIVNNWEYFIIGGHGELKPTEYNDVPANTYLIFNAPAGCIAVGTLVPYFETTVADSKEEFAGQFFEDFLMSQERIKLIESGRMPSPDPDFLLKTLAPSERRALAGRTAAAAAAGANFGKVYPGGFERLDVKERTTFAPIIKDTTYTAKTIYGPGEKYPNLEILFKNNPLQTILLGAYELPIPRSKFNELEVRFREAVESKRKTIDALPIQGSAAFARAMADINRITEESDQTLFSAAYGNMLSKELGKKLALKQILTLLPAVPAGKKRFIFVTSCRGIESRTDKAVTAAQLARMARAASIANNNAEVAALEAGTAAAATEYFRERTIGSAANVAAEAARAEALASDPKGAAKRLLRTRNTGKISMKERQELGKLLKNFHGRGITEAMLRAEMTAENAAAAATGGAGTATGGAGTY